MPDRECLPDRRASWTQRVRIDGQTFYASFGEYPDGRLGEVWLTAARAGAFLRDVMGTLARLASVSLQCGTPVSEVVKGLRLLNYPPSGPVEGSPAVTRCTSLADWLAQEIEAAYLAPAQSPAEERVAGAYHSGSGV